jgi:predicted nucleic acid-binding Zn ribbon protein
MTQATRSENIAKMAIFHRYSCRWWPTISRACRLQHRCTAKRFQAFQHAKSTWKESKGSRHLTRIYPPSTYPDGMPKTSPGPSSRAGGMGGYEGHHLAVSKPRSVLRKPVQADIKNWHLQ